MNQQQQQQQQQQPYPVLYVVVANPVRGCQSGTWLPIRYVVANPVRGCQSGTWSGKLPFHLVMESLTLLGLHVCLLIISLIIFFSFFCLARSSRVGDLNKNTRTPHARSCTAPQSNAVPAKGQQKTLKSNIYIKGKSFH